ncbi:MAG: DUF6989 domain-containing protein [Promethearchaeota archaeon]
MMKKDNIDFMVIHAFFSAVCVIILLIPIIPVGIKLFLLVLLYNIMIPFFGIIRKHSSWFKIWLFAFILSLLQIWPDWFLASQLNALIFPPDGFIKIGSVSGYMAGLWTIPFFLIIYLGANLKNKYSEKTKYIFIGLISLLIFGIAEQTMWLLGSWHAINVTLIGYGAIYIIIPEIILGLTCFYAYEWSLERSIISKIVIAFLTMIIYLGNAASFYFLFEKIIFT